MAKSKIIENSWNRVNGALQRVESHFICEGYDTQLLTFPNELILQVRDSTVGDSSPGFLKLVCKATGTAAVATLKATRVGQNDVQIEAVGGKWLDKAAVMGVSMVVLWPLFVTSSVGMLRQNALISRVFDETMQKMAL